MSVQMPSYCSPLTFILLVSDMPLGFASLAAKASRAAVQAPCKQADSDSAMQMYRDLMIEGHKTTKRVDIRTSSGFGVPVWGNFGGCSFFLSSDGFADNSLRCAGRELLHGHGTSRTYATVSEQRQTRTHFGGGSTACCNGISVLLLLNVGFIFRRFCWVHCGGKVTLCALPLNPPRWLENCTFRFFDR
eukprot:4221844-Amphidinium_carterae.1